MNKLGSAAALSAMCAITAAAHATTTPPVPRPIPMAEICMFDGAFNAAFGPDSHPASGTNFPTLTHAIYEPVPFGDPANLVGFAVATFGPSTISVTFTSSGTFTGNPLFNAMYFTTDNIVDPPPGGDDPFGGLTITGIDPATNMPGFTTANLFHPVIDGSPGLPDIEVGGLSYSPSSRIVLDVALIPAPASAGLLMAGVAGMLLLRRPARRTP